MSSIYRITAQWNGFQGAPGYSKFSFVNLTTDAARNSAGAAIRTYFAALSAFMQASWSITVSPTVQEYEDYNATFMGEATMSTAPTAVVGTGGSTAYAAGSGFVVSWKTNTILGGHRVQGRTFHVPAILCFDTDGSLTSTARTTIQSAADALVASPGNELAVWGRTWSKDKPPVATGGAGIVVTTAVVKDAASQLRSRRN